MIIYSQPLEAADCEQCHVLLTVQARNDVKFSVQNLLIYHERYNIFSCHKEFKSLHLVSLNVHQYDVNVELKMSFGIIHYVYNYINSN